MMRGKMEIIGSLALFILFIIVYLIIIEIFVMLFRITGLSREKARFQVISMLTNSGYTTKESELVLKDDKRRKLARFVMMFGYSFTVTIVSAVVNIFLQFRHTVAGGAVAFFPLIILVVLISWIVKKKRLASKLVENIIGKLAKRYMYKQNTNPIIIIDEYSNLIIAKVYIIILPDELNNKDLQTSKIKQLYGINVLAVKTNEGEIFPNASTIINIGDIIVVMGEEKNIRNLFELNDTI
ncbi:hypothetical protein CSA37_08055 [Candidatus Fermentibacteria bacterium]|nr:MAG: hypothetical protein CSA37_08055 [Candidatus Fermentibacteria bacterium]